METSFADLPTADENALSRSSELQTLHS